jgi:O-antigen ligase
MVNEQGDGLPAIGVIDWWEKGVFFFLTFSIFLLGVGRFALPFGRTGFSAWSISRTTFFFWLIWKVLLWFRNGRRGLGMKQGWFPLPLLAFFAAVTVSLLPDFHEADDYRYFFFAVMHCLMVLDLFGTAERRNLLLVLLGILPGILVIRGIIYNPSVLNFEQMNRFAYPVAHANPAGLLFSMSIPLTLTVMVTQKGALRGVTLGSLGAQFAGLVLTYSRGAWLACGVSLVGLMFMEYSLRKAVLALGLAAVLAFVVISPLRHRFLTLLAPEHDVAIEGRLRFMADALAVGLERPIWGIGYGRDRLREGVKREVPAAQQFGFIPHSHNVYTELLAETGVVGISAFLWMILSAVTGLIRKARSEPSVPDRIRCLCLAASLIAFLVGGLGDVPFYNHDTRIFFFTLMAMTYLALRTDIANDWEIGRLFSKSERRSRKLPLQANV